MTKSIVLSSLILMGLGVNTSVNAQGLKDKLNQAAGKTEKSKDSEKEAKSNFAPAHTGAFTDELGVSGLYHLWRNWTFVHRKPGATSGKELEANTININFSPKDKLASFYLIDGQYVETLDLKLYSGETYESIVFKTTKEYIAKFPGNQFVSTSSTENMSNRSIQFFQLEPGVIMMGEFYYSQKEPFVTLQNEATLNIMAKDPKRIADYTFEKLKEVAMLRAQEINQIYRDAKAGNTKLPEKRSSDASLNAMADKFMRQASKDDDAGDWSAGYQYGYVASRDWNVNYVDPLKTTPAYRTLTVVGVATSMDQIGKCFYQGALLQQNWNGTEYGPVFFSGFGGGKVFLTCENAAQFK